MLWCACAVHLLIAYKIHEKHSRFPFCWFSFVQLWLFVMYFAVCCCWHIHFGNRVDIGTTLCRFCRRHRFSKVCFVKFSVESIFCFCFLVTSRMCTRLTFQILFFLLVRCAAMETPCARFLFSSKSHYVHVYIVLLSRNAASVNGEYNENVREDNKKSISICLSLYGLLGSRRNLLKCQIFVHSVSGVKCKL